MSKLSHLTEQAENQQIRPSPMPRCPTGASAISQTNSKKGRSNLGCRGFCWNPGDLMPGYDKGITSHGPSTNPELSLGFEPVASGVAGQALFDAAAIIEIGRSRDRIMAWACGRCGIGGCRFFRNLLGSCPARRFFGCGLHRFFRGFLDDFLCSFFRGHGEWRLVGFSSRRNAKGEDKRPAR